MGFLDNTVGQLSRAEAEWLRCSNLKDDQEVATFMQKYQLSEAALRQWQAANRQRNECFNGFLPFDQSQEHKEHEVPSQESEFVPDSMELSASEEVPTSPPVTRQAKGKRNHTPTPMVKKHVPGAVVNAKNDKVPLKKTKGSNPPSKSMFPDTTRNLLTEFAAAQDSDSDSVTDTTFTPANWQELWDQMKPVWGAKGKYQFPTSTGCSGEVDTSRNGPA
ncbi:hypothetical protein V7S43_009605 [Phytophthora oleae]|uniref:Uncharacterized protein n=1 Tax=Phytophthora oleae TaxID=2107226 RepID=A0ABD3FGM8_9STRA